MVTVFSYYMGPFSIQCLRYGEGDNDGGEGGQGTRPQAESGKG